MFENTMLKWVLRSLNVDEAGLLNQKQESGQSPSGGSAKEEILMSQQVASDDPEEGSFWSECPSPPNDWEEEDIVTLRRIPARTPKYETIWVKVS